MDEVLEFFTLADQEMVQKFADFSKPWLYYCNVYALDKWDFHRPGGSTFTASIELAEPDADLARNLARLAVNTEYSVVTKAYAGKGELLDGVPAPWGLFVVPPRQEAEVLKMADGRRVCVNPWLKDEETCYIIDLPAVSVFHLRHYAAPGLWLRRADFETGWPATAELNFYMYAELADESKVKRWIP